MAVGLAGYIFGAGIVIVNVLQDLTNNEATDVYDSLFWGAVGLFYAFFGGTVWQVSLGEGRGVWVSGAHGGGSGPGHSDPLIRTLSVYYSSISIYTRTHAQG